MKLTKIIITLTSIVLLYSCADYKTQQAREGVEKNYYFSKGFALVYNEDLYYQKVVNKKFSDEKYGAMHNLLKVNTSVKIINPSNSKFLDIKISKKANYPKIFNIVLSRSVAFALELDMENPYVEVFETKKNKTFVAKESNTFEEEKNVSKKVPVDEVKMDDLTKEEAKPKKKLNKKSNFILVISDFYFKDSANKLKEELIKKTKINNISVKKINDKKYRLFSGPFKNFNALKTSYISLNNLGFEDLNIYRE